MTLKLIKARGLLDVERGVMLPHAFVVVKGDRISAVGSRQELTGDGDWNEVVDLSDHYLLPGLINSHGHLCLPADETPLADLHGQSDAIWLLAAARNARTALTHGVTTVRDCGDRNGLVVQLRGAIEKGLVPGPDIISSGTALTITGGHFHQTGGEVDGAAEMVKAVRRNAKNGSDFIKIMATGGDTHGTYPELASFSVAELSAAVAAAHGIGRTVTAHCRGIPGIRNAVEAGVDHIEHACFELPGSTLKFDQELADRIAAGGIYVTPTIHLYRMLMDRLADKKKSGRLSDREKKTLASMTGCLEEKLRSLKGLLAAGVMCVAGDDAGFLPGFDMFWRELDAMVKGGMSTMQAIASATIVAAEALGHADRIGSIEAGKQADIIAVKDNPCQDVRCLASPAFVMRAGQTMLKPAEIGTG